MTDKDPEVVIEDNPELPIDVDILTAEPEKKAEAKVEPAPEKKPEADSEAIESLRRQLEELRSETSRERELRVAAEKQARELATETAVSKRNTLDSQLHSVQSELSLTEEKASKAERDLAAAMEIADYTAAAKAQRQLTEATTDIQRLKYGEREIQRRVNAADKVPVQQQVAPGLDETIEGIKQASSPKARTYIERNRASLTSEKHLNRMIAAHNMAVNSDIEPDTDEYFSYIDRQMGWGEKEPAAAPVQRQQRTVAAPVSRTTAAANGDLTGNKITLTREQAEFCREMGISPVSYAKNLQKLRANGKDPMADGLRLTADMRS
ncbi:MAG TPA: hypothetical protein VI358_18100 [Pseudolabrys sp.]